MKTINCERCGMGNQQSMSMINGKLLCGVCKRLEKEDSQNVHEASP